MTESKEEKAPRPQRILHDPDKCTGCGLCDLMCSLYHEGEQGPALSRSELTGDRMVSVFTHNVCLQCPVPHCYHTCPKRDEALCIDQTTGTRYINPAACDGCAECIEACPFDPPRIKLHPKKNVAFMCDTCRGRAEGPICIEYCSFNALSLVRKGER